MTIVNRTSRPHRPFRGFSDDWLTPPEIIAKLGAFDLDPCCPESMPWNTASVMYSRDGLNRPWSGRIWLNPPYGPLANEFMANMASHNRGTALVFARTETQWFHDHVWRVASAIMFFRGRLHFHDLNGIEAKGNAGGPSVLVAYGTEDAARLKLAGFDGRFIELSERM